MMNVSKKRKPDADDGPNVKRKKGPDGARQLQPGTSSGSQSTKDKRNTLSKPSPSLVNVVESSSSAKHSQTKKKKKDSNIKVTESTMNETPLTKPKHKIKKLIPPRPFPTVPASVSATGPRSAHKEGKNYICLTRKTPLGAYLRRCKEVIMKDGYKTLHLSAMGAAIPHLATLAVSLPSVLPFAPDEIHSEILTGSVEVQDEIIPEDEDEDISYQTRAKSTLSIVIKIGDGDDEVQANVDKNVKGKTGAKAAKHARGSNKKTGDEKGVEEPEQIILQEPEQEDMDIA